MKKILIFCLVFSFLVSRSQNARNNDTIEYTLRPIFKIDTTGTYEGRIVNGNNFDPVRFRNDTLLVDLGLYYLSKNYNFQLNEDSVIKLSDTILFKEYPLYILDSLTNRAYDTLSQKYGFYWQKSIPIPDDNFINPALNIFGNKNTKCSTYHYQGPNNVCSWIQTCPVSEYTNWCSGKVYTKVFEDNFEGDKLNLDYWRIGYPWGRGLPGSLGWAAKKNATVSGGILKLFSTYDPGLFIDDDDPLAPSVKPPGFNWVNGVISSNFKSGYGKYEIRAKIPPIYGISPCYWLFGQDVEIDGWEFFRKARGNRPTMSVYSSSDNACSSAYPNGTTSIYRIFQAAGGNTDAQVWPTLPNLTDGLWRNYTIVYDPNYISWWVEDFNNGYNYWVLTFHRKVQQNASYADPNSNCTCSNCNVVHSLNFPDCTNNNVQLILNNVAVCNSPGQTFNGFWYGQGQCGPINSAALEIDWVKIYQTDDCGQNKSFTQGDFANSANNKTNSITADNITLGGSGQSNLYSVKKGNDQLPNVLPLSNPLFARANQEVQLIDGFAAEEGSLFEATNAFSGNSIYPSDCQTLNFGPQYARSSSPNVNQNINITKLNYNPTNIDIVIYQNPTAKYLQIKTTQIINKIEILDLNGKIISFNEKPIEHINIESLLPGLYLIKFYYDTSVIISKFIKE